MFKIPDLLTLNVKYEITSCWQVFNINAKHCLSTQKQQLSKS